MKSLFNWYEVIEKPKPKITFYRFKCTNEYLCVYKSAHSEIFKLCYLASFNNRHIIGNFYKYINGKGYRLNPSKYEAILEDGYSHNSEILEEVSLDYIKHLQPHFHKELKLSLAKFMDIHI